MSDDFGTVNIGKQQMARELEMLRQRYMGHREALVRLEADAPSEELAASYRALQQEIDAAVAKLTELSRRDVPKRTQPATAPLPAAATAAAAADATVRTSTATGGAGDRPLHHATSTRPTASAPSHHADHNTGDKKRLFLIVGAAALMLLILAVLLWRSRGDETPTIVEEQPATVTTATAAAVEQPVDTGAVTVNPESHDFGVVRKGTRAVRQFRIENSSDQPVAIAIDRSACRCLWFDFDSNIPANSSSILAITVDGARANRGRLDETVTIKNKGDADDVATIKLLATIE